MYRMNNYVEDLDLNYRVHANRKVLEFEDGVEYTLDEALILSKGRAAGDDLKAIHLAKKVFDGELVTRRKEDEYDWKDLESTRIADRSAGRFTAKANEKPQKTSDTRVKAKRKASARIEEHGNAEQTALW